VTAVLDFDWSYTSPQLGEEYLRSLGSGFYIPPSASSTDPFEIFLRKCILSKGDFEPIPESLSPSEDESRQYAIAKILHHEFGKCGVKRPCEIDGFVELQDIWGFNEALAPLRITTPFRIERLGEEKCAKKRVESEKWLVEWLEGKGF
jgi:hypothetical protein